MSLKLKSNVPGSFVANIAPCGEPVTCGSKNVSFAIEFLDPLATRATEFIPAQEYVLGGTQMRVLVNNLPSNISAIDTRVEFVGIENVTTSAIEHNNGNGKLVLIIPQTNSAGAVQIKVHFLSSGLILTFLSPFTYIQAPIPEVTSIVPTLAAIQASSRVRISLKNFPRVLGSSDVKVRFQWGSTTASASVVDVHINKGSTQAIQDLDVDIDTPVGSITKIGSPDVVVFHQKYGETSAVVLQSRFIFIDALSPQVKQLTSSSGVGMSEVRVPMTVSSEIIALFENAPRKSEVDPSSYVVQLGDTVLDILSADVADNREALIILSTFPWPSSGTQHAIIAFGKSCSSSCCEDMSCSTSCPGVKTTCFKLVYYDDTLPMLSIKSDLSGPEIGGDILNLEIANFPVLNSIGDVSVSYQVGDAQQFIEGVSIESSDAEIGTVLMIVTPAFEAIDFDQTFEFTVEPKNNPQKSVSFFYLVQAVQPQLKSFTPSVALSIGGQKVLVDINYFEYPADVQITFGDFALPDNSFSILSISSRFTTLIRFETPKSDPGVYEVVIRSKMCAKPCAQAVRFVLELLDATLPEMVVPVPLGASFQKPKLPPLYLEKVPQDLQGLTIKFESLELSTQVNVSLEKITDSTIPGVKVIYANRPFEITEAGHFMVSLHFSLSSGVSKKSLPFSFSFYDGFLPRVILVKELTVPTSVMVGGRKLQLKSKVSITCMNFPQSLLRAQISVVLGPSSQPATVLQIMNEVSCPSQLPDCNRSVIVLETPSLDSPGVQEVEISQIVAGEGARTIVESQIEYVPPCDFDRYCQDMGLITNFKLLADKPVIRCNFAFCIDPSLIGVPVILEVLPSEGSKSGGTLARVKIQNLPAFSPSEVSLKVKSSISEQTAQVASLSQTASSSLVSSNGELTLITPQFTAEDEFATVEVSVTIAGKRRVASFLFEYLPVIAGPAVVSAVSPQSIFNGEELRCTLRLENVPRLKFPFSSGDMMVKVSGTELAMNAVKVSSSDRYSTTLMFTGTFSPDLAGTLLVHVGSKIRGEDGLGMAIIDALETPLPRFRSSYPAPDFGVAGNTPLKLSVTFEYLPPSLNQNPESFSASLFLGSSEYAVQVTEMVKLMDENCIAEYCSLVEFKLLIPALSEDDSDLGGMSNITISLGNHLMPVSFRFFFRAAGAPFIETISPSSLSLNQAVTVALFLENFPSANCKANNPPSCAQEASTQGLNVTFDNIVNPLRSFTLEDSNGKLVVRFAAPTSERAGAELGMLTLENTNTPPVTFFLQYDMPAATVMPKDGRVTGKEAITITASGWWGNGEKLDSLPSKSAIHINIGGTDLIALEIISVEESGVDLVIKAMTPLSNFIGTVPCTISASINGKEKISRFTFDFFKSPEVIALSPATATLTGKTTSGNTVQITITNFPSVSSAGDLLLEFGKQICDGSACGITEIRTSNVKGESVLFIRARIPSSAVPGNVVVHVQPSVNVPGRQLKSVQTLISYYKPLPVISSVRWCQSCTEGSRTCIVMGKCHGSVPLDSLVPMSGGGVITVVIDDPPDFKFVENGQVTSAGSSNAIISLALGTYSYGEFSRVAYGDGNPNGMGEVEKSERVALEFNVPQLFSAEGSKLTVMIHPEGALASSSASELFSFYDSSIEIVCLEGCDTPAIGQGDVIVAVKNLPLNFDSAAIGQVDAAFGEFPALSVDFDQSYSQCPVESTCLRLGVPSCNNCKTNQGIVEVVVSVSLKGNPMRGAKTSLRYYSSPTILSAMFDFMGTSIIVRFEQNTDQGGMNSTNSYCAQILDAQTVNILASKSEDAACVWESSDVLNVFLGSGAQISPGDSIVIREDTLQSSNLISGPCVSCTAPVSAPAYAVAPIVTVKGSAEIDPCSELELRAMADSPRPLEFSWSCRNDAVLDEALRSVKDALVFFEAGTKEMSVLDKSYEILVVATNFLGTSSEPVLFTVRKKGSPAPLLTFIPPTVSMYRDESSLVNVVAKFSNCPIEKGKMIFAWKLISATEDSEVDPEVFTATGPQLLIPKNVLKAGSTYTLGIDAFMDNDPSKASKGTYSINVKRRLLVANMIGGNSITASTSRQLVLDGKGSFDPDYGGTIDTGIQFSWSCTILDGNVANPCRTRDGGTLALDRQSVLIISKDTLGNMFTTATENPYFFSLSVSKAFATPKSFSMPVFLTEAVIPDVAVVGGSGSQTPSGVIRINSADQLVLFGHCSVISQDLATTLTLKWSFEPDVSEEFYDVINDMSVTENTQRRQTLIVSAQMKAFVSGGSYMARLQCTDAANESATSTLSLSVNSPPRGNPCFVCRLSGSSCAKDKPDRGAPIFDTFRFSCPSWADTDSPLQYQFKYSGNFDGKFTEVMFDWGTSPAVDLILPPGEISLMARVRDSFGGSTEWMDGGMVFVGVADTIAQRRNILQTTDSWAQAEQSLKDTLDSANFAKINQLVGALAMQVNTRVANAEDSDAIALFKKETLLQILRTAVTGAIKTEGYVCESLSVGTAVSSNVSHISVNAMSHIANVIQDLSASGDAATLSSDCAQSILILISSAFEATFENSTCLSDRLVDGDKQGHMNPFMHSTEASLEQMLRKSSSTLLTGQEITMQSPSDSATQFSFIISKMSPVGNIDGKITPTGGSQHEITYRLPEEVRDSRLALQSSIAVLFGTVAHPPALLGINPISPVVALSFGDSEGNMLNMDNLSHTVNITIPISADHLCGTEQRYWTGKGRCLYYDTTNSLYSPDGCTTHQATETSVTCMCTHLTSFVVEVTSLHYPMSLSQIPSACWSISDMSVSLLHFICTTTIDIVSLSFSFSR